MLFLALFVASMTSHGQELSQIVEQAMQGDAVAQNKLGIMYASGNGVTKDFKIAAGLFKKAANQDLPGAQYNLGRLYQSGLGVPQDNAIAANLYRKAAESGDAKAQYNLGYMYANGVGVERDPSAAAMWIAKAADQGLPVAQEAIARLDSITQGLEQSQAGTISPESMASIVRKDDGQGPGSQGAGTDSEEQRRKADALARIRQQRAGGTESTAGRAGESTTQGTGQDERTLLKDRRLWMTLLPLLVGLGVYWQIRSRNRKKASS